MASISESVSNASKLVRQAVGSALSSVHAGDEKIASRQPHQTGSHVVTITSSGFTHGSPIPKYNTPQGENISPDLSWSGIPADTKEIVLIVEDPDAPFMKPFVHWILHGLPGTTTALPVHLPNQPRLAEMSNAVQGTNDAKTVGWYGPKPPLGHGRHHYHFQLFALDVALKLGPDATLAQISQAMRDHVIADGEIVGTYERTADSD